MKLFFQSKVYIWKSSHVLWGIRARLCRVTFDVVSIVIGTVQKSNLELGGPSLALSTAVPAGELSPRETC